MTLNRLLRAIFVRWYVTLLGLALTAGLCFVAFTHVGPTFSRGASELLVPGSQTIPEGGNAYLYLGDLTQASDVLVNTLQSDDVQERILSGAKKTDVVITRDASTTGPILVITVTGPSRSDVDAVFRRAQAEVPTTLTALQDRVQVPLEARISSLDLTADPAATADLKPRYEAMALAGAVGLAITLLAIGLIDGLLTSREARRREQSARSVGRRRQRRGSPTEGSELGTSVVPSASFAEQAAAPALESSDSMDDETRSGAEEEEDAAPAPAAPVDVSGRSSRAVPRIADRVRAPRPLVRPSRTAAGKDDELDDDLESRDIPEIADHSHPRVNVRAAGRK